jgi:hypothetical protein
MDFLRFYPDPEIKLCCCCLITYPVGLSVHVVSPNSFLFLHSTPLVFSCPLWMPQMDDSETDWGQSPEAIEWCPSPCSVRVPRKLRIRIVSQSVVPYVYYNALDRLFLWLVVSKRIFSRHSILYPFNLECHDITTSMYNIVKLEYRPYSYLTTEDSKAQTTKSAPSYIKLLKVLKTSMSNKRQQTIIRKRMLCLVCFQYKGNPWA